MTQPGLFDASPCPHHGPDAICTECPEEPDTDGQGFPHRQVAKGRLPLKRCRGCHQLKSKADWSEADFFKCRECDR